MQTCMIVDDSNVIRKVATRILVQLDFTVENAASAAEATALIEAGGLPDMIIAAATLPDLQGGEWFRALRAREGGGGPVILASLVEAHLGLMTRLKRSGATGFVYKPFDRAAITRWIEPYRRAA